MLSLPARGAYLELRLLAAQTWNSGSIRLGTKRAKVADVVSLLARLQDGTGGTIGPAAARMLWIELKKSGLFGSKNGVVFMADWDQEQKSMTPAAMRQRKKRDLDRATSRADELAAARLAGAKAVDLGGGGAMGGDVSPANPSGPSPCPPSISNRDVSRQRHGESEEDRKQTTHTGFDFDGDGGQGDGPEAFPNSGDLDAWTGDPVAVALALTGESGDRATNTRKKQLRDHGRSLFCTAVAELQSSIAEGRPMDSRGAVLSGIIKRLAAGGNP